jgi:hypothetical protein
MKEQSSSASVTNKAGLPFQPPKHSNVFSMQKKQKMVPNTSRGINGVGMNSLNHNDGGLGGEQHHRLTEFTDNINMSSYNQRITATTGISELPLKSMPQ